MTRCGALNMIRSWRGAGGVSQLTTIERPGGTSIDFLYDALGRPLQVLTPDGSMDYDYDPVTGRLAAITAPSGEQLNFTFDGVLPTIVGSVGEVSGTVEFTYDDDFNITAVGVENELGTIQFDYFHLDELAFGLNPGETIEVKAGDQIGTAGFTGFDPAEINVHVHFQMKMGDTLVDPMAYSAYLWKFHKCKCAQ